MDLLKCLYNKTKSDLHGVDISSDINLAVTFKDSLKTDSEGEYEESPLVVKAFIDKIDKIYNVKTIPGFQPSRNRKVIGIYDPSIQTAQVSISTELIKSFNINQEDNPTLLLYLGKNKKYKNQIFKTFNIQAQFTKTNNETIPVENIYNYGKVIDQVTHYYKLKHDIKKNLMKIILSFNSNYLSWSISDFKNAHENTTKFPITSIKEKGKIIITIEPGSQEYIYLNLWINNYTEDINSKLLNYAFKYINIESEVQFFDYQIYNKSGAIEYKEEKIDDKMKITCTYNRIDITDNQANVTYFLKIADANNYIENESFSTIAVTESPFYTKYIRNPQYTNNKITLSVNGDFKSWCYIQIIALIQRDKNVEYIAYDGVKK